ncbi:MAG: 4Fe-4S binding protein, partial [Promethearchaeota archaeon]
KGCGACVAECPVNAINQNNFTSFQINKMIETLIEF